MPGCDLPSRESKRRWFRPPRSNPPRSPNRNRRYRPAADRAKRERDAKRNPRPRRELPRASGALYPRARAIFQRHAGQTPRRHQRASAAAPEKIMLSPGSASQRNANTSATLAAQAASSATVSVSCTRSLEVWSHRSHALEHPAILAQESRGFFFPGFMGR